MTFGELLRNFLRAVVPARDRWVVQVLNHRLARYLKNAFGRYGLGWAGIRRRCARNWAASHRTVELDNGIIDG